MNDSYVISLENKIKDLERERGFLRNFPANGTRTGARQQLSQTPVSNAFPSYSSMAAG